MYQRKVREDKKNRNNIKIQDQLGLRALIAVELKSYIAILAPPKHNVGANTIIMETTQKKKLNNTLNIIKLKIRTQHYLD